MKALLMFLFFPITIPYYIIKTILEMVDTSTKSQRRTNYTAKKSSQSRAQEYYPPVDPFKEQKRAQTMENKLDKLKRELASVEYAIRRYKEPEDLETLRQLMTEDQVFQIISPADLKCLDIPQLRALKKKNEKDIAALYISYEARYTTKANIALYKLMCLALEAELQNILHTIKYGKLDDCIGRVRELTSKYYAIAIDGNKTIESSVKKFIAQLEHYYMEAVKIEYEYYVQKERQKEEQREIRERARQEAADRRANEMIQKKLEEEAKKYDAEIQRLTQAIQATEENGEEYDSLMAQLEKVMSLKDAIEEQQEELLQLQNGKAGTVYIISNIGAFGDGVFKVGMTRRLIPQDRINELSSASVPFPFDVHSMIFSEDAPALETKLHHRLESMRVNKVNAHKEFFRISVDDIEQIVHEEDPTAEFRRTAMAEQYNQSLSIG